MMIRLFRKREPCQPEEHEWIDKRKALNPNKDMVMLYSGWYFVRQKCAKCGEKRTIERVDILEDF